jgi:hypothetical protein
MRRFGTRGGTARLAWVLVALSGSVLASQAVGVDEDSMQLMDDRTKSLTSNLALENASGAAEDARALAEMFSSVEGYYLARDGGSDALDWARQSRTLSDQISQQVSAKAFDQASQAAAKLSKTCKACHTVYKAEN